MSGDDINIDLTLPRPAILKVYYNYLSFIILKYAIFTNCVLLASQTLDWKANIKYNHETK